MCSCLNGLRIAGICVHVATVLMHFSYETADLISPAEHLMGIFIEDRDLPYNMTKPKIIKQKRRKINKNIGHQSNSSDKESRNILNEQDILQPQVYKNKRINKNSSKHQAVSESFPNKNLIEEIQNNIPNYDLVQSDSFNRILEDISNEDLNYFKNIFTNDIHDEPRIIQAENITIQDHYSSIQEEPIHKNEILISAYEIEENDSELEEPDFNISIHQLIFDLRNHMPKWGGKIIYKDKLVAIKNTCSIDYLLFSLFVLYKVVKDFLNNIPKLVHTNNLKLIVKHIDSLKWDDARQVFLINIAKYNQNVTEIDTYGSEFDWLVQHLLVYQLFDLKKNCVIDCRENDLIIWKNANSLSFHKRENIVDLFFLDDLVCTSCKNHIRYQVFFKNKPNFFYVESINPFLQSQENMDSIIEVKEIPKELYIDNKKFSLLLTTINDGQHFRGIFFIEGNYYISDDIDQSFTLSNKNLSNRSNRYFDKRYFKTSTSLYYLNERS